MRLFLILLMLGCATAPVSPPLRFPGTAQFKACKADCDADGAPGALVIENEIVFDCWCQWPEGQVYRPGKHPTVPEHTLLLTHDQWGNPDPAPKTCNDHCKKTQCDCVEACKKIDGKQPCFNECYDQREACKSGCNRG